MERLECEWCGGGKGYGGGAIRGGSHFRAVVQVIYFSYNKCQFGQIQSTRSNFFSISSPQVIFLRPAPKWLSEM
jgi:hypothetical protein